MNQIIWLGCFHWAAREKTEAAPEAPPWLPVDEEKMNTEFPPLLWGMEERAKFSTGRMFPVDRKKLKKSSGRPNTINDLINNSITWWCNQYLAERLRWWRWRRVIQRQTSYLIRIELADEWESWFQVGFSNMNDDRDLPHRMINIKAMRKWNRKCSSFYSSFTINTF